MTKNGAIASSRATPCPANGWSYSTASKVPNTTVIASTEPTRTNVFHSEVQKSGSVTRNS